MPRNLLRLRKLSEIAALMRRASRGQLALPLNDTARDARTGRAVTQPQPAATPRGSGLPDPQTPVEWAAWNLAQAMMDKEIIDYIDCISRDE